MKKIVAYLLIILGIIMIYVGGFYGEKMMLPPIITGFGFFAIAAVFLNDEKQKK